MPPDDLDDLDDLDAVEHELREAARERTELAGLRARRGDARRDVAVATAALEAAHATSEREAADVAALETWSPTRIWAGLRGARDVELSREQAERRAADYARAVAAQRHASAVAALEQVDASIRSLGDPDERYRRVLAAKEALLVATEAGPAGELVEIAERLGELDAETRELDEADAAAAQAHARLDEAVRLLADARSWSTWDTFGGGGLLTDMMKYDRMDDAAARLREADAALRRLRVELADVDLSGVPDVAIDQLLQTFDVWFDNIFSDWSVRSRITDAHGAASRARADVQQIGAVLRGRREETGSEAARLHARRTEILAGET
jgi:hypothetical protein